MILAHMPWFSNGFGTAGAFWAFEAGGRGGHM
jgi:hypothetical protein